LLSELKEDLVHSRKGEERGAWFIYTLLAIILPFTSSRTSNLLRALKTLKCKHLVFSLSLISFPAPAP